MYIMTFIKQDFIFNRKVHVSEMSKINSLCVKKYSNIVERMDLVESIANVSLMGETSSNRPKEL